MFCIRIDAINFEFLLDPENFLQLVAGWLWKKPVIKSKGEILDATH